MGQIQSSPQRGAARPSETPCNTPFCNATGVDHREGLQDGYRENAPSAPTPHESWPGNALPTISPDLGSTSDQIHTGLPN
eukprot:scaffold358871_cov46-Prasinocladus_malaysianus.AAC.1